MTKRHRRDGYDVCDDQHCQVYAGVRAESRRSREIVDSTRGRVVTYHGKVAHVIYSSDCGGYTQSGRDPTGWGTSPIGRASPTWRIPGPRPIPPGSSGSGCSAGPKRTASPPPTSIRPISGWTRVISFRDLEDKLDRKYHIGKLRALRPLRRSPSGNVNAVLIVGSKRKVKITSELDIRGSLSLGSLRSTQFIVDLDYTPDRKPQAFVFHGGGWGHGVGLCQSGAMGRAEAGQDVAQTIKRLLQGHRARQPGLLRGVIVSATSISYHPRHAVPVAGRRPLRLRGRLPGNGSDFERQAGAGALRRDHRRTLSAPQRRNALGPARHQP